MKELKKLKGFWKIIFILVAIYVGLGGIMFWYYQSGNGTKEAAGQFGDMFGGITALFGTLTFAGVLYTIILQRKELMLTRKEMKLSRLAFEEQNITTKIQRFENTFFRMVELVVNAKESQEISTTPDNYVSGDSAMHVYLIKLKDKLEKCGKFNKANLEEYQDTHTQFYMERTKLKVYYLRVLNVVELIQFFETGNSEKQFYLKVLRSNITSEHELVLLYYFFCLNFNISDETRKFLLDMKFFEHLYTTHLGDDSHLGLIIREKWKG